MIGSGLVFLFDPEKLLSFVAISSLRIKNTNKLLPSPDANLARLAEILPVFLCL
jgi:hypothetical protein